MNKEISIVIIGRNEESSLADCITAAQSAADQIGGAEIIFVDSASTDNTVKVAESHGVSILALASDQKLCPSAGRFAGANVASGEFILFLDADTLLYRDFLPAAIDHFRNNPDVGGANGRIDDLNEAGEVLENIEERYDDIAETKWLRGPCCFYRRKALLEVGSFNPDIAMEEEAELGLRLVSGGWKLHLIPIKMACHTRCYHVQTLASVLNTFKRDIVSGRLGEITKTIVYAFKAGNGFAFCWLRLKTTIIFLAWIISLLVCILLPLEFKPVLLAAGLTTLGAIAILYKKRSPKQAFLFVPNKILSLIDIAFGITKVRLIKPDPAPGPTSEHAQ